MTRKEAEALKDIDPRMKDQAAMVWKIERAMRKKVKALFPTFEEMPVAQAVTSTQGEEVLKSNPAMQEIRATFRDYCTIVKSQMALLGDKAPAAAEVSQLDTIRAKLKIAK